MSPRLSWMGGVLLGLAACAKPMELDPATRDRLAAVAAEVDPAHALSTVSELVDAHRADTPEDCTGLRHESFAGLCHLSRNASRTLLESRLAALGLEVRRQDAGEDRYATSNVVAELRGTTRPDEIILVGAHFDAFYAAADDNSSGVAALLEAAEVLSHHRFERTLRFVGFDLEEFGLIGSTRFVDTLGGERIHVAVVLDSIGYYSSEPGSQRSIPGLPAPDTGDFLAVIANDTSSHAAAELYAVNAALRLMNVTPLISPGDGTSPMLGNLMRSDHTPFWLASKQALFFTDTANFRNPNYHRSTDRLETLEPVSYGRAVQVLTTGLAYWAVEVP